MKTSSAMSRRQFVAGASGALLGSAWCRPARSGAGESRSLRIATFCGDVTPPLGFPSYPSFKPLATIEHPLLAKGIVIDDGCRRYVLCAFDWCVCSNGSRRLFRQRIAEAAGTDVSAVALHMVHQHTAPIVDADSQTILDSVDGAPPYLDLAFLNEAADRLAAVVEKSLAGMRGVDRIGMGEAKVDRVASSRRIHTEDGKFHGRMSSTRGRPHLRELPEGLIDPLLKTITFADGNKALARLHYYATHPQSFYGDPRVTYDFPGIARERLEDEEDVFQVYFTGCAGDIAAGKYNDGSPETRRQLAERLLAGMKGAIAATKFAPAGPVVWRTTPVLLPPKLAPNPKEAGLFSLKGLHPEQLRTLMLDPKERPNTRIGAARRLAFLQRADLPIELSGLQLGRIFLVHLPGEPMVEFQLDAQRQRPDDFVAVAGYGEGCTNYICTAKAFEEGGYEPTASSVGPESERLLKAGIRHVLGLT